MKAQDTFWQNRKGLDPILLKVLKVEERMEYREICRVKWYIIGKDKVSVSVFPMATHNGGFMDFVPISRSIFQKAVAILKETEAKLDDSANAGVALEKSAVANSYRNAKRRIVRLIERR